MAAETFFARWSRRKTEANQEAVAARAVPEAVVPAADVAPAEVVPTLEQVAALKPEDDFTPFVARGVDESVRRAAMKKLFADPHFNVMDGLDTYIEDYNKFVPLTAAMIASLNHAKDLLDPLAAIAREQTASTGALPPPRQAEEQDTPPALAAADDNIAEAVTEADVPETELPAESQEADEHPNQSL